MGQHHQRHLQQHQNGRIADTVFKIGQMAFGHIGCGRQHPARHAATRPEQAHTISQCDQKRVLAFLVWIVLNDAVRQTGVGLLRILRIGLSHRSRYCGMQYSA